MTIVKVCGIRTAEEGRVALTAGANWLGFVFWDGSKRRTTPPDARPVVSVLRTEFSDWSAVGVFVNPTLDEVDLAVNTCGLDYVQLSGHETADFVAALPYPTVKALHVRQGEEAHAAEMVRSNAYGATLYLLDTHLEGRYGGTGQPFAWDALREVGPSCLVGGGLRAENVHVAMDALAPLGVDVSSGVEFPAGGKDPRLVRKFLEAVRSHELAGAR